MGMTLNKTIPAVIAVSSSGYGGSKTSFRLKSKREETRDHTYYRTCSNIPIPNFSVNNASRFDIDRVADMTTLVGTTNERERTCSICLSSSSSWPGGSARPARRGERPARRTCGKRAKAGSARTRSYLNAFTVQLFSPDPQAAWRAKSKHGLRVALGQ